MHLFVLHGLRPEPVQYVCKKPHLRIMFTQRWYSAAGPFGVWDDQACSNGIEQERESGSTMPPRAPSGSTPFVVSAMLVSPFSTRRSGAKQLLNEPDRLQAEVRIAPRLDQTGGGYDGFAEPDVVARDAQKLPARFIVFNNLKPKAHWVESTRKKSLISQCFKIR
jgi:hypothetical protein